MARLLAALILLLAAATSQAAELITAYDSRIKIDAAGALEVTETISVIAEHDQINRGIYRDFPTVRGRAWWGRFRTSFDVIDVQRNGRTEGWFTERIPEGVRLYIGRAGVQIPRGPHTYTIRYRTDRQIGFFADHDELYWNVTGNRWVFPIRRVSATVSLPSGADASDIAVYTGPVGATGQDAAVMPRDDSVEVETTRMLGAGEGLTIVVAWPKGFVRAPLITETILYAVGDNRGLAVGFAGLVLILAFYAIAWAHYGKDPEEGTLIAQYDPPPGLSPAACRYIDRMGWDPETFTAALVSLAARGFVTMENAADGTLLLRKADKLEHESSLSNGERAVLHRLFTGGWTSLPLRKDHYVTVQEAMNGLMRTLGAEHDHVHFLKNLSTVAIGWSLSLIALTAMTLLSLDHLSEIVVGLVAGGLVFLAYGLIRRFSFGFKIASGVASTILFFLGKIGFRLAITVLAGVFALPTVADILNVVLGPGSVLAFAIMLTNVFFLEAMRAPTHAGRKVMDHIAGFRHYLIVAEKDRLNFHNPPDLTPQRFEAYLPYAIALDVENDWGDQFNAAMKRAAAATGSSWQSEDYSPRWYSGWRGGHNIGSSMSTMTNALGKSVATALTPPSKVSGTMRGSGGGFSGGGGGGGGGGGW